MHGGVNVALLLLLGHGKSHKVDGYKYAPHLRVRVAILATHSQGSSGVRYGPLLVAAAAGHSAQASKTQRAALAVGAYPAAS